MIDKLNQLLFGNINKYSSDAQVQSKAIIVYYFGIIQLLNAFFYAVICFFVCPISFPIFILLYFVVNIGSLLYLKYSLNILNTTWVLLVNSLLFSIITILGSSQTIDFIHGFEWFIILLLVHFVVGKKGFLITSLFLMIFSFLFIFFNESIAYFLLNNLKVSFMKGEVLQYLMPFSLLVHLFYLFILLNIYHQNHFNAYSKAENTTNIKNDVLHVVAHDLRSPLSSIKMANELIRYNLKEPSKDDGESMNYSKMIDEYSDRGLTLITDLIETAEVSSEAYELKKEKVNITVLVQDLIKGEESKAKKKNIELLFENHGVGEVGLSKPKISRVIINLLSNAIKFSNKGGRVLVSLTTQENMFTIIVKDDGIGIPDKFKNQIFDKFTVAGRRGTNGEKSLGLGMSISKRIVELHKGKIWFESVENQGTTFYVQLPK